MLVDSEIGLAVSSRCTVGLFEVFLKMRSLYWEFELFVQQPGDPTIRS